MYLDIKKYNKCEETVTNIYRCWVCQHVYDIEVWCVWNLPSLQLFEPILVENTPKVLVEWSRI